MAEQQILEEFGVVELIFSLTNEERTEAGRTSLTMNNLLRKAAQNYAQLMSDKDELGHAVNGQTVRMRLAQVGYKWSTYGENVAYNSRPDAQRVMNQWIGSPGHRANILNGKFKEIGIGVAGPSSRNRYYYCQIFGRPQGASFIKVDVELVEQSSSIYAEGGEDA
jgi:uncharacterized protein YkwD